MTIEDALFLAVRLVIAGLCIWALARALGRLRAGGTAAPRPVMLPVLAVLLLGIGLVGLDAWENAVLRRGQPIEFGSWLWLAFEAAVPLLALRAFELMGERDAALAQLAHARATDALTGLPNRGAFLEAARKAVARARGAQQPVAVVAFRLDGLRAVNEAHGHAAGDDLLAGLAGVVRRHLRGGDVAGRLGGADIALLCPGLDIRNAAAIAERQRAALRAEMSHPGGPAQAVTASAGIAELAEGEVAVALEVALAAAEQSLRAAGPGGRDRVVLAGA